MHHKGFAASPLVMGLCRMLIYVTAGLAVAGDVPGPLLVAAAVLLSYLIGLTYAAKQETKGSFERFWPLAFLAAPFVYGLTLLGGGPTAIAIYAGFLAWVLYSLSFLLRPDRVDVPRAVVSLIAGISLLDALLIAGHGAAGLAWVAVGGFVLTLVFQRAVPGT